jgi:hypothetical protein
MKAKVPGGRLAPRSHQRRRAVADTTFSLSWKGDLDAMQHIPENFDLEFCQSDNLTTHWVEEVLNLPIHHLKDQNNSAKPARVLVFFEELGDHTNLYQEASCHRNLALRQQFAHFSMVE